MKKLLHKIFLLSMIFICNAFNQSNATKITNFTDKIMFVKAFYNKSKCAPFIHLGKDIDPKIFYRPIIKIEPKETQIINLLSGPFIEKIVIEIILQKNQRLRFEFKECPFKDFNDYFLTLVPDPKTTFQIDLESYESSATTWKLKISTDQAGSEGSSATTTPEEISNSY